MTYWKLVQLSCAYVQIWSTVIGEIIWLCRTLVTLAAFVYFLLWINEQWRTFVNYMNQPLTLSQKDKMMRTVKTREARLTGATLLAGDWPMTPSAISRNRYACKDLSICCLHGRQCSTDVSTQRTSVLSERQQSAFSACISDEHFLYTEVNNNFGKKTTTYKEVDVQEFQQGGELTTAHSRKMPSCASDSHLTDDEKSMMLKAFSPEKQSRLMLLKSQRSVY